MLKDKFMAARRAGTPLVAIQTADPAGTVATVLESLQGLSTMPPPIVEWDIVNGLHARGDLGTAAIDDAIRAYEKKRGPIEVEDTRNDPVKTLVLASFLPERTIVFFHQAHRYIAIETVAQAIWNLRDAFKGNHRTLVLLCPSIQLPSELQHDVVILDEPLPAPEELESLVQEMYEATDGVAPPTPADISSCVAAVSGLARFSAEQAMAMSMKASGIYVPELQETKHQMIERVRGLTVYRGKETFADIRGCENVKETLCSIFDGIDKPQGLVFIDEGEKYLGAGQNDETGVSQANLGQMLTMMQDTDATGMIFYGPPGAAKSACSKAAGNQGRIITMMLNPGEVKGSHVGESEENMATVLKTVRAVGQDKLLFIMTCNKIVELPPELTARFVFGTFFFDLPTADERESIWQLYVQKFGIELQPYPEDEGWTGREIRACCMLAHRLGWSLKRAAQNIVPVAQSAPDVIEKLRQQASGRFLSAATPGLYRYDKTVTAAAPAKRKIEVG